MTERQLRTITAALDSLGAKLSTKAEKERTAIRRLTERVAALDLSNRLPAAVAAALEADDRDPFEDPTVQREAARTTLTETAMQRQVDNRAAGFLTDHAEAIIEALRAPFDSAAEALTDAHRTLGDVDLTDAAAIVRKGGTAAQTMLDANAAQGRIESVRAVLGQLMTAGAYPSPSPHSLVLALADPPAEQWLEDRISRTKLSPWELVRRGFPLSLATPEDLRRRVADIYAASEQVSAKFEVDRRNAPNIYRHTAVGTATGY